MTQSLLIIGGDGAIGHALCDWWSRCGREVQTTTRRQVIGANVHFLDLSDPNCTRVVLPAAGAAVICAGVTSVEHCRRDPKGTRRINVEHTWALASRLLASGVFVVFLSSNLVFDGSVPRRASTDAVCPRTEYGRQKTEIESRLSAAGSGGAIVRLTKVFYPQLNLLSGWTSALVTGRPVEAFTDMVCAPLRREVAVRGIATVVERRLAGCWQFSADRDVTYWEIATRLASKLGVDPGLVRAKAALPLELEHLPLHSSLDTSRAAELLGLSFDEPLEVVSRTVGSPRPSNESNVSTNE